MVVLAVRDQGSFLVSWQSGIRVFLLDVLAVRDQGSFWLDVLTVIDQG